MNVLRRPALFLLAILATGATLLLLSWHHVLPGGWFLRNLLEAPRAREARIHREHRQGRLEVFARENADAAAGSVIFLGSSTMESFPLATSFPGKPWLNRGIGGENAEEMEARLEASLPTAPPAGLVLYAGSRDLRFEGLSPEATLRRLDTLMASLRRRQPDLVVLILGLLPTRDALPEEVEAADALDAGLQALASRFGAAFLPISRPPLREPDGGLAVRFSRDRWHLNQEGYEQLAAWILAEGGAVAALLRP